MQILDGDAERRAALLVENQIVEISDAASRGLPAARSRRRPSLNPDSPATYWSAVDVDEAGAWVVTHPPAAEAERRVADLAEIPPLGPQIDRHPFDVIAVFRYPLVAQVHFSVGRGRAITAHHQKRIERIESVSQHSQHIKDPGIHRSDFIRMMIPQDPVDVPHRLSNVMTVGPIDRP
jgi:hypothetical protein